MKKFSRIILIVLCLTMFAFFAIGSDEDTSYDSSTDTDTDSVVDDADEDDEVDDTISDDSDDASDDEGTSESEATSESKTEEKASESTAKSSDDNSTKTSDVTVKVTSKSNQEADILSGRYYDRVNFVIEVTNNTKKDIQGVKGVLTINDLFGDKILSVNCDFTGETIPAGKTVEFTDKGLNINELYTSHTKLYSEKYENLSFSYKVSDIVYAESSSGSESKTTGSSEVTVTCTAKTNQAADIWNGITLPRCYFTLVVKNNTSKNIKGIKGVMTVSDLFGTKIKAFNCDLTSQTIPAGGSVTIDTLYLEINSLLSDEVKLYNESFEDLQFSYKVSDIAYE